MSVGTPAAPRWWDLPTQAGRLTLSPVKPERDLPDIHRWMNDPTVARYWELDGPIERVAEHVAGQRAAAHTEPYVARLAGRSIGYWEVYRAAEDRLAEYYPALRDDVGVHFLIGEPDCRGIGLGTLLLRVVCDAIQTRSAGPCRVVAEPDARNTASVRAFRAAGFEPSGIVDLPEKRAVLVIRSAVPRPRRPSDAGEP
jgi:RimJ/RimL family protein N-acetyltransferase